jgi:hypothetical protein
MAVKEGKLSVSVDRDFARFGSKSYAINKINSVEVRERHPYGTAGMLLAGLGALICVLSGGQWIILGLMLGAVAYWAWRRSQIIEYQLFLMTSSSEAQAIVSRDGEMIDRLRDRIETAMTGKLA